MSAAVCSHPVDVPDHYLDELEPEGIQNPHVEALEPAVEPLSPRALEPLLIPNRIFEDVPSSEASSTASSPASSPATSIFFSARFSSVHVNDVFEQRSDDGARWQAPLLSEASESLVVPLSLSSLEALLIGNSAFEEAPSSEPSAALAAPSFVGCCSSVHTNGLFDEPRCEDVGASPPPSPCSPEGMDKAPLHLTMEQLPSQEACCASPNLTAGGNGGAAAEPLDPPQQEEATSVGRQESAAAGSLLPRCRQSQLPPATLLASRRAMEVVRSPPPPPSGLRKVAKASALPAVPVRPVAMRPKAARHPDAAAPSPKPAARSQRQQQGSVESASVDRPRWRC
ncbi:hypothetical protein GPECTOR_6g609 [Gonium pectorale]|uniref:Uncharacterized protein n=1 Tax=Gonium pectorale TaxID=33097 RepID=A0A150GVG4_GONPE|nr:hypothetical protein GPECTOR_6g609 [Gonium pectorale]|eukprot:KXZ53692.1 hypothetical protein GPECTOR_6g609 [Gonium pectorale]